MIKFRLHIIMAERNILKIKEMAGKSSLDANTIAGIYHNKYRRIDLNTLNKICRTLNCTPADLFEYIPDTASDEPTITKEEALYEQLSNNKQMYIPDNLPDKTVYSPPQIQTNAIKENMINQDLNDWKETGIKEKRKDRSNKKRYNQYDNDRLLEALKKSIYEGDHRELMDLSEDD